MGIESSGNRTKMKSVVGKSQRMAKSEHDTRLQAEIPLPLYIV